MQTTRIDIDHTTAYEARHEAWDDRAVLRHVAAELAGLRNKDGTGFYRMTRLAQAIINELIAKVESHLGDDLPGPGDR
jgi:hypothetical protein